MRRTLRIFTIFVIISFLLLLIHPVPASAGSTSNLVSNQNTVLTLSGNTGAIPSTNSATSFTIPLGNILSSSGQMFDAADIVLVVYDDGTSEAITSESVQFAGSINGQSVPPVDYQTYPSTAVSINPNTAASVFVPINSSILPTLNAVVNFSTAPTAGEVYVTAYVKTITSNLVDQGNAGGNAWNVYAEGGNIGVTSEVPYSTDVGSGTLTALDSTYYGGISGGTGTAQVRIQGTWVGTVSFYYELLGYPYYTIPAEAYPAGGGSSATSTNANGTWNIPLTGLSGRDNIEVEMTSYTSGTADVTFSPGGPPGIVTAVQPTASNLNETPNLNNSPVSITNGLYTVPGRIQVPRFVWSDNRSTIAGINACLLGNATSTEFVTGISFDDTALTAGTDSFEISLYSTQASGGTSTALNPISTNDSTLYGTGLFYTAAPTAGTEKGQLASYFNNAPSTISSDTTVEGAYINLASQPIRINSGQEICVVSGASGNLMSWNIYGYEIP